MLLRTLTLSLLLSASGAAFAQDDAGPGDHHGDHHDDHHGDHGHAAGAGDAAAAGDAPIDLAAMPEAIRTAVAEGGDLTVVDVNGLVCDFCAEAMTRVFGRRDEVAAVHVDLDTKQLRLVTRADAGLEDAVIEDLVRRSGYQLAGIRRVGS